MQLTNILNQSKYTKKSFESESWTPTRLYCRWDLNCKISMDFLFLPVNLHSRSNFSMMFASFLSFIFWMLWIMSLRFFFPETIMQKRTSVRFNVCRRMWQSTPSGDALRSLCHCILCWSKNTNSYKICSTQFSCLSSENDKERVELEFCKKKFQFAQREVRKVICKCNIEIRSDERKALTSSRQALHKLKTIKTLLIFLSTFPAISHENCCIISRWHEKKDEKVFIFKCHFSQIFFSFFAQWEKFLQEFSS